MPVESPRAPIATVGRYAIAGVANTLVGAAVIGVLDLGLSVAPAVANMLGYLAGFGIAHTLNRHFVFTGATRSGSGARFIVAVALAFGLNQIVLAGAGGILPGAPWGRAAAQLSGMASYTLAMFALCAGWVYRASSDRPFVD